MLDACPVLAARPHVCCGFAVERYVCSLRTAPAAGAARQARSLHCIPSNPLCVAPLRLQNEARGIDVRHFGELLMVSGVVLNEDVSGMCKHGLLVCLLAMFSPVLELIV